MFIVVDQRVISSFRKHMATLALESPDWPVVVIATTSTEDSLSSDVHEAFLHQINIEVRLGNVFHEKGRFNDILYFNLYSFTGH